MRPLFTTCNVHKRYINWRFFFFAFVVVELDVLFRFSALLT